MRNTTIVLVLLLLAQFTNSVEASNVTVEWRTNKILPSDNIVLYEHGLPEYPAIHWRLIFEKQTTNISCSILDPDDLIEQDQNRTFTGPSSWVEFGKGINPLNQIEFGQSYDLNLTCTYTQDDSEFTVFSNRSIYYNRTFSFELISFPEVISSKPSEFTIRLILFPDLWEFAMYAEPTYNLLWKTNLMDESGSLFIKSVIPGTYYINGTVKQTGNLPPEESRVIFKFNGNSLGLSDLKIVDVEFLNDVPPINKYADFIQSNCLSMVIGGGLIILAGLIISLTKKRIFN